MIVDELEFDDDNEAHIARHGVTVVEILQVRDNPDHPPRFFRNRIEHEAPYVMIGYTLGGRILCVPLQTTHLKGVWRPATAYDADDDDRKHLR